MTLALRSDGAIDAPAIVLLHAIATTSDLWAPQVATLASRFRVVRIDLPGHGGSALLPGEASYAAYADAVVEALQAAGITRFSLTGLSFGAMVSMQIAALHPARVQRLVLACCAAYTPAAGAEMWAMRSAAVARHGMTSQVEGTLDRWFTPGFATSAPLTVDWVRRMVVATSPAGFIAAADMIAGLDHRELLTQIAAPTLVLAGKLDQAAPPDGLQRIAHAIPGARFATLDAAHLASVEAPVAFIEAVAGFVGDA